MEDKLFDTPEKRKKAEISFSELAAHPGWILFTQILDANIEVTQNKLNDRTAEHTKEGDDALREKLDIYKKMKNTPQDMIAEFNRPNGGVDPMAEMDPYDPKPERK